MFKVLLCS